MSVKLLGTIDIVGGSLLALYRPEGSLGVVFLLLGIILIGKGLISII